MQRAPVDEASPWSPTGVMSGCVDARLSDMVVIWIGKEQSDYNLFIDHPAVKKLARVVKNIVQLPNPCFPDTMLDSDSGFEHIVDVELLDIYRPEMRAEYAAKSASVGCCTSHRRAWNSANLSNSKSKWAVFIEEDFTLRDHAAQLFQMTFEHIVNDPGNVEMVFFSNSGGNEELLGKAKANSKQIVRLQNMGELRSCPSKKRWKGGLWGLHFGQGMRCYALSGPARERLLLQSRTMNAWEMDVMFSILQAPTRYYYEDVPCRIWYSTTSAGDHTRDNVCFFAGSARRKRDANHHSQE